ncbi:MAG: hypothetical protein LBQ00_06730 [Syntrophobacterales bacterium]|jgi:transposase-like protein|nr:hypothetical protein [Syntrophobacterales bacterium]
MDNPICWNCPPESGNVMKRIGATSAHYHYQCQVCGVERMELREDRPPLEEKYRYLLIREE